MPRLNRSNPKIKHRAIALRKEPTPAESRLWAYLRTDQLGTPFRRQHANALRPFRVGSFITDFCAPQDKLIIELDGSQHLKQEEQDAKANLPTFNLSDLSNLSTSQTSRPFRPFQPLEVK
jgi:very-short-patch-repair endonuclease